jgi:hypothetical protein
MTLKLSRASRRLFKACPHPRDQLVVASDDVAVKGGDDVDVRAPLPRGVESLVPEVATPMQVIGDSESSHDLVLL